MDRVLFESASAARRVDAALAVVRAALDRRETVTVIAPTREAGRELVRRVASERGSAAAIEPTTLAELALPLARSSLLRRGESALEGAGLDAVVAHAIARWCFPGGVSQIGESCELVTCEFGAACAHPARGAPGVCVPACDLEADCGPREACREGACTPVCEPTDPRACPEGSLCDQGVCTEAQLLTTCFDGAACALGTICRSTSTWHECVAADDPRYVRRCGEERILVDGVCYPRGA